MDTKLQSRLQRATKPGRIVAACLGAIMLLALAAVPAGAIVPVSDYSSNPAASISCVNDQSTISCMINAPIDAGSSVIIAVSAGTFTVAGSGGPQTFIVPANGTSAVVSFVVSGVTYSAVVIVDSNQVPTPTATPVVTPVPTTVPGTVTPVDYGFGNGIPTKPAPLAITGSNSRYLIAGGLAMVLSGVLLMQRRPELDEL